MSSYRSSRDSALSSTSAAGLRIMSVVLVILLMITMSSLTIRPVKASGNLNINPASQPLVATGVPVTFQVNVTGMYSFNGYDIYVAVNDSIMDPVSITISNILGTQYALDANCVNAGRFIPVGQPGDFNCAIHDGLGIAHAGITSSTFSCTPQPCVTTGLLFTVTFNAVNTGPYTFVDPSGVPGAPSVIFNGSPAGVSFTSHRGLCGSLGGNIPTADFTWSPIPIYVGKTVTFDASLSQDDPGNNPNGIASYIWDFGDGSLGVTTPNPIVRHDYRSAFTNLLGNFTVALQIVNRLGISSDPTRHTVTITKPPSHDLAVAGLVSTANSLLPGTMLGISVIVLNNGTFAERGFNLTVSLGSQILGVENYTTAKGFAPNQEQTFATTWDTKGVVPGTYVIVAQIEPIRNATGFVVENNTINNTGYDIVIVYSFEHASFIPFTILQTIGLGVASLVAVGI